MFATILFCTLVAVWQYAAVAVPIGDPLRRVEAIATFRNSAPFAYRVLVPLIVYRLGNTFGALLAVQTICFTLFYGLLWAWARCWRVSPIAALGVVTLALIVMMPTFFGAVYSVLEWCLWLGALLCLPRWSS